MLIAHKIELRPSRSQAEYLNMCFGHTRHLYNQLLEHFNREGVKWSKKAARQHFYNIRCDKFPWYSDISAAFLQETINNLDNAYKNFFRRVKQGEGKCGYPKFKKAGIKDSCAIRESVKFSVDDTGLRFEKFNKKGDQKPIKIREKLRFTGEVKQMNITKRGGKYFCAFLIDTEDYNPKDIDRQPSVGVDFGIKDLAVLSTGIAFPPNQKLKASIKRLNKKQRLLSRKKKGSKRRARAKQALAKLHKRISDQRAATLHGVSDYLTKSFDRIVIEDLDVSGMLKNKRLARSVADCGFYELRRQLEYKSKWRCVDLVIADRYYPSTKTCSDCGNIQDMDLSIRTYDCKVCGLSVDRDLNAAYNLNNYQK